MLITCHFSAAAGKAVHSKPPPAHSGNLSVQQQQQNPGSTPQAMGELSAPSSPFFPVRYLASHV